MLNSRLLIADGLLFVYILWLTASIQYGSIASTGFVGFKKIHNTEKWFRFTVKMFAPILVLNALSVMGDGPNWHSGRQLFVDACHRNYWKNLLFINNFEEQLIDICNPFTWILAVIFQLQIISPFLMIPFRISPKWGFITAAFCYAMSVLGIVWSENFKDMNKIQNKLNLNIWFIFGKILWSFGNLQILYLDFSSMGTRRVSSFLDLEARESNNGSDDGSDDEIVSVSNEPKASGSKRKAPAKASKPAKKANNTTFTEDGAIRIEVPEQKKWSDQPLMPKFQIGNTGMGLRGNTLVLYKYTSDGKPNPGFSFCVGQDYVPKFYETLSLMLTERKLFYPVLKHASIV
ncbi:unnamed protein product [Medioppia subpectinata]|uniref:Uncharacterized protein n=1 Tax=Medioppia subpectinata TaxID=1979941 RepID=A0A7R9Q3A6_9ACAR|nr:unnamed protein product [Medioppia subpectinata]CAG2110254.1 unnamed protein product [Medioppia subpectinata]